MGRFRQWVANEHGAEFAAAGPMGAGGGAAVKSREFKPWRASKDEIIDHWNALRPNLPIVFDPINRDHKGSTFGEDGIRLTGSKRFIDSILGRLKDLLAYEGPNTKLDLVYRQTQYKGTDTPDKSSTFAFYIQVREKAPDMPATPKRPKVRKPVEPEIGDAGESGMI